MKCDKAEEWGKCEVNPLIAETPDPVKFLLRLAKWFLNYLLIMFRTFYEAHKRMFSLDLVGSFPSYRMCSPTTHPVYTSNRKFSKCTSAARVKIKFVPEGNIAILGGWFVTAFHVSWVIKNPSLLTSRKVHSNIDFWPGALLQWTDHN